MFERTPLSSIVAMDQNRLIGKDNHLPWRIPEDMAYFKKTTLGHNVVMGRKTWLTMGKPLEQRTNIVLSRDRSFQPPGIIVAHDLSELEGLLGAQESFIIGGANIFEQFMPYITKLYLTKIEANYTGDTWFPAHDESQWELDFYEHIISKRGVSLSFNEYKRIKTI